MKTKAFKYLSAIFVMLVSFTGMAHISPSISSAANTASERLYDHDDDSQTDPVRQFAGSNRYATSARLARAYFNSPNSSGSNDTLIVASGESLIDAAASAGLAGYENAPVMLTNNNRLSGDVRRFINDEVVSEVIIVGGIAAISRSVEDTISNLDSVDNVIRLSGNDRYRTAVKIAETMTPVQEYCNDETTVILANVDNTFADIIAVGPLAASMGLPILLTGKSGLSSSAQNFLVSEDIEQVIIIGGIASIPGIVEAEITAIGVSSIERISGKDRYATAVAILDELADCPTISFSNDDIAFVNGSAAADGVSAAPLLAIGLNDYGNVTPALLVTTSSLPGATQDYLTDLPVRNSDSTFLHLNITAIGGKSVISDFVLDNAISLATTSEAITAEISTNAARTEVTVEFSSAVDANDAVNRNNYRIAGAPLLSSDTVVLSGREVTITFSGGSSLDTGTLIEVLDNRISALGNDDREVRGVSYRIPTSRSDRRAPLVKVVAPVDGNEIRIISTDDNQKTTADNFNIADVQLNGTSLASPAQVKDGSTDKNLVICLFGDVDADDNDVAATEDAEIDDCDEPTDSADLLASNDKIKVIKGAFIDNARNESRETNATVRTSSGAPTVDFVRVTKPIVRENMDNEKQNPTWQWLSRASGVDTNYLTITGKSDGSAAGARGNAWNVDWYPLDSDDNTASYVDIDVIQARKVIRIEFDDDATVFNVAQALDDSPEFNRSFIVTSAALGSDSVATDLARMNITLRADNVDCPRADDGICGAPASTSRTLSGGQSEVELTITWSEIIETFAYDTDTIGLIDTNVDSDDFPASENWQASSAVDQTLNNVFKFTVFSDNANLNDLPESGDIIDLPAGLGTDYSGEASVANTNVRLRAG